MDKKEILEYLVLAEDEDFMELGRWGLPKQIEKVQLNKWLKGMLGYPGLFLKEDEAAASVGLDVNEFRKHHTIFDSCKYKRKEGYYWAHKLKELYMKNLRQNKIYSSLIGSNEKGIGVRSTLLTDEDEDKIFDIDK